MSPDRLGLVYALARLLEAFESATPRVSHGDLSAKNVLWSLARGPEIFVLDCDNGERWECGRALGPIERRRAMTPNWDDPAVAGGTNPGADADRYSLALIFLRVCGAAHFPIQKRQKAGEVLDLEVGVPGSGRRARSLGAGAPLWDLCARGLGVEDPASRPPASAWVEVLEQVIDEMGARRVLDAVWASQGRGDLGAVAHDAARANGSGDPARASGTSAASPGAFWGVQTRGGAGWHAPEPPPVPGPAVLSPPAGVRGAVTVRPVATSVRFDADVPRRGALAAAAAPGAGWTAARTATGGLAGSATGSGLAGYSGGAASPAGASATLGGPAARSGPSAWQQVRHLTGSVLGWMLEEHRRTLRYLRTPNRRWRGLLRIPWCAAVDFLAGCVVLFVVAMLASPFLGI